MPLGDDLQAEVKKIFATAWSIRDGRKVPEPVDVKLGNDAVRIAGTVLYADLVASTALVDTKRDTFSAEIYKTYLHCAAKIIRSEGGIITSYDGDRIMAVFIGDSKNSTAARTALKINYAVRNIINPAIKIQYKQSTYEVRQTVGIDTSELFVAQTGIRGSNDLVWVGRAANYAAKLTSEPPYTPTWITGDVYKMLSDESIFGGSDNKNMWRAWRWTDMNDIPIYSSSYWWKV